MPVPAVRFRLVPSTGAQQPNKRLKLAGAHK